MHLILVLTCLLLAPVGAWAGLRDLVLYGQVSLQAVGLAGLIFMFYLALRV